MSKGSKRRPEAITREQMDEAWRRTFEQTDDPAREQPAEPVAPQRRSA